MHRLQSRRGFTFLETLVAGGILMSLGLVVVMWLSSVSDLWWTSTTQSQVRTTAEQLINRLTDELKNGTRTAAASPPNATIPASPNNTAITFYLPTSQVIDASGNIQWDAATAIQYVYVPAAQELRRVAGGVPVTLSGGVTSVRFEDSTINAALYTNEIRVILTVQQRSPQQRTMSATATEIVKLRN